MATEGAALPLTPRTIGVAILAGAAVAAAAYAAEPAYGWWLGLIAAAPVLFLFALAALWTRFGVASLVIALVGLDRAAWEVATASPFFYTPTFSQQAIRLHAAVLGAALAVAGGWAVVAALRDRRIVAQPLALELAIAALVPVAAVGAVVGIASGNQMIFVVGDTYRLVLVPVAAFLTVQLVPPERVRAVVQALVIVSAAAAALFVPSLVDALVEGRSTYALGAVGPIVLIYLAAMLMVRRWWGLRFAVGCVVLATLLAINLLTLQRGIWITSVLSVVLVAACYPRGGLRVAVGLVLCGVVLVAGLVAFAPSVADRLVAQADQRLDQIVDPAERSSLDKREGEVRDALDHLDAGGVLAYVVGRGSGAEYPTTQPRTELTSRPGQRHQIHVTWISVLFRTGVVGLLVVVALILLALAEAWQGIRAGGKNTDLFVVLGAWVAVSTVALANAYGLIGELSWGLVLGLLATLARERRGRQDAVAA